MEDKHRQLQGLEVVFPQSITFANHIFSPKHAEDGLIHPDLLVMKAPIEDKIGNILSYVTMCCIMWRIAVEGDRPQVVDSQANPDDKMAREAGRQFAGL